MKLKLIFLLMTLISLTSCYHSKKTSINSDHLKINDDIYLKPIGKNKRGCSQFTPYSLSGNMITQVVYYLDEQGNPTTISNPENCK